MPSFDVLAPPFFAACLVLCASGFAKIRNPEPTARALRGAALPSFPVGVQALGGLEVAAGAGGLFVPNTATTSAVGVLYLGFAAFLVFALARDLPGASCGCAGERDVPPTWLHVALDLIAAAAAFAVAATGAGAQRAGLASFALHHPAL